MDAFHQALHDFSPLTLCKEPCDYLLPPVPHYMEQHLSSHSSSQSSSSSSLSVQVASLDAAAAAALAGAHVNPHTPSTARKSLTPNHPEPVGVVGASSLSTHKHSAAANALALSRKPNGSPAPHSMAATATAGPTHQQIPSVYVSCVPGSCGLTNTTALPVLPSRSPPAAATTTTTATNSSTTITAPSARALCHGAPLATCAAEPDASAGLILNREPFQSVFCDSGVVLGQGVSGEIRVCTRRCDGREFAFKMLPYGLDAIREVRTWHSLLPHPHIVPLVAVFDNLIVSGNPLAKHLNGGAGGRVIIAVMPRMASDLLSLVRERSHSDDQVKELTRQVLTAVAQMHSRGIVHNDIKLENVLLAPADMSDAYTHTATHDDQQPYSHHTHPDPHTHAHAHQHQQQQQQPHSHSEEAPMPETDSHEAGEEESPHPRYHVMLCDFGFARAATGPFLSSFTRAYISPEALAMLDRHNNPAWGYNARIAAARDVWAVGVLAYILHTRRLPFHELPGEDRRAHRFGLTPNLRHTIARGIYHIPSSLSGPASAFLRHVLVVDPRARPMAATLLLHPWLLGDHVDV